MFIKGGTRCGPEGISQTRIREKRDLRTAKLVPLVRNPIVRHGGRINIRAKEDVIGKVRSAPPNRRSDDAKKRKDKVMRESGGGRALGPLDAEFSESHRPTCCVRSPPLQASQVDGPKGRRLAAHPSKGDGGTAWGQPTRGTVFATPPWRNKMDANK